jgi:ribosomal protein S3AE
LCFIGFDESGLAADGLRNRVFELNLGDLKPNSEEDAFRKLKFRVEEVQGKACLTNFYGMDMTTDKLRSLVRKWQSLIECHTEVKTSDGFNLRVFAIAFTKRRPNQAKKTAYAQSGQVKNIRKKMVEIIQRECSSSDLMTLCNKFMAETIGKEIEKACAGIYPLQNVFVRKVKSLRAPKLESAFCFIQSFVCLRSPVLIYLVSSQSASCWSCTVALPPLPPWASRSLARRSPPRPPRLRRMTSKPVVLNAEAERDINKTS